MPCFRDIGLRLYIAPTISSVLKLPTRYGMLLHAGIQVHMRAQMC